MTMLKVKLIGFGATLFFFVSPIWLSSLTGVDLLEQDWFSFVYPVLLLGSVLWVTSWLMKINTQANHEQLKTIAYRLGLEFVPPQKYSLGQQIKLFFAGAWALNQSAIQKNNKKAQTAWACLRGSREGRSMQMRTIARSHGRESVTYTTFSLQLNRKLPATFQITREGFGSKWDKFFGAKEVEVGVADFDDQFMVRTDNEPWLLDILDQQTQKELLAVSQVLEGELSLKDGCLTYDEATDFATDDCRKRFEKIIQMVWSLANRIDT